MAEHFLAWFKSPLTKFLTPFLLAGTYWYIRCIILAFLEQTLNFPHIDQFLAVSNLFNLQAPLLDSELLRHSHIASESYSSPPLRSYSSYWFSHPGIFTFQKAVIYSPDHLAACFFIFLQNSGRIKMVFNSLWWGARLVYKRLLMGKQEQGIIDSKVDFHVPHLC